MSNDKYIIVDIEASGPNPGNYSMLSIGACTVSEPLYTFYIELKPDKKEFITQAMEVNKLSMEHLIKEGINPKEALREFADWIEKVVPDGKPIFTAFNAPFDWMFVNDYFLRYLGKNPFGHKALDIKALFMGKTNVSWEKTSHKWISKYFKLDSDLPHHALQDALIEANLLKLILSL